MGSRVVSEETTEEEEEGGDLKSMMERRRRFTVPSGRQAASIKAVANEMKRRVFHGRMGLVGCFGRSGLELIFGSVCRRVSDGVGIHEFDT